MITKFIKNLFKKKELETNSNCVKNITLKLEHMKKYFPEFKKLDSKEYELEFSPGNSLNIYFEDTILLYISSGNPESGYSTVLYSENPSHSTIKYCMEKYSTKEYKVSKSRLQKLDNLGI